MQGLRHDFSARYKLREFLGKVSPDRNSVTSWFWWFFNISPHHIFFGMLTEGNVQGHSLYFFSGGGTCVIYRCMEKWPTVPTKSLWLSRLAIPSPTDLLKSKYTCAMKMLSWLIKLFIYAIFCKNCKNHVVLMEWPGCYLYWLAKHLQSNQKLCLVGATNTNLIKSLEQRFTSNEQRWYISGWRIVSSR